MKCPGCGCNGSSVFKTIDGGKFVRRQRRCECGGQWTTSEQVERGSFLVIAGHRRPLVATPGALVATSADSPQKSESGFSLSLPLADQNPDQTRVSDKPPEKQPVFVGMPLAKKGAAWDVPVEVDASLAEAFPSIDRRIEYAKAADWLRANPTKRKTPRGMHKFLSNWFEVAQNRGRASPARVRDTRCAFHLNWNNRGRVPPGGVYPECPECKHARAAMGTRQGEPTAAADALAATERKVRELRDAAGKTWTPDQLAEMRATRAQKIREPAEPRPPPLNAPSAASPAVHPGGSSVDGSGTPAGYPGVVSKGGS